MALEVARCFRDRSIRIVDLGSGAGSLSLNLARLGYRFLVGVDISSTMCRIARFNALKTGFYSHLDFILGDVHSLPFRDGSIHCFVSTSTLHHIRKPYVLFREIMRTLDRGGSALIYEFSHDVNFKEAFRSVKILGMNPIFIPIFVRLAPMLHGIPRREFEEGWLASILRLCCKDDYELQYNGIVTLIKLKSKGI